MLTLNQGDNMSNEQTILFVICFSVAIILLYQFIKFKNKIKNMELIDATCTDTTLKTTYQKNIRIYYYTYIYKNEEYKTADKTKFLIPGFNPKIKKVFKIYINPKNPNNCVTPLELYYSNIYILFGIILLIIPFLF